MIDKFFDQMQWNLETDPSVALVSYGELMNMVNSKRRWIYKGSVTTPPCAQSVFWNVLSTVYPIK